MPNPNKLERQRQEQEPPDYIRSVPDSTLLEGITALAGAIEVLGDIANLSHAKRLLEEARNNA